MLNKEDTMSKKSSNNNSGFFGNIFDLDGDGKTDVIETTLMFAMFNEIEKDEEKRKEQAIFEQQNRNISIDDMDIDGI